MSKNCHRILIFLIALEVTTHAECLFFNRWRHLEHRGVFFLRPSPEEDLYAPPPYPPINLFKPITQRRPVFEETSRPRDPRPWRPSIRESRRHVPPPNHRLMRPIPNRSAAAASPSVVTAQPQIINIPLKKSIRVSNTAAGNRSRIQTTGFIKNGPRSGPMKVEVDDVVDKQTTAPSEVDVTEFDDRWKPKRMPYPKPSIRPMVIRKPPPMQFTRFGDKMIAKKPDLNGDKKTNVNPEDISHQNAMKPPGRMNGPTPKKINAVNPHVTYAQDSNVLQKTEYNEKGLKLEGNEPIPNQNNANKQLVKVGVSTVNPTMPSPNLKGTDQNNHILQSDQPKENQAVKKLIEVASPDNDNVFFIQTPSNTNDAKDKMAKLIVLDPKNRNSLPNSVETKSSTESNRTGSSIPDVITGRRIISNPPTSTGNVIDPNQIQNVVVPQRNDQNLTPTIKETYSHVDKSTEVEKVSHIKPLYPNVPFFGSNPSRPKDYSKEIKEDPIYFPQHFPNYPKPPPEVNSSSLTKNHRIVHISNQQNSELERLVEFSPKSPGDKQRNEITNDHYHPLPKAATKDFFSLVQRVNTPPSLITVASDQLEEDDLYRNHKKSHSNRTNTYVLERPPLLPKDPSLRRPNIRLSTGMLAGILIAALIFLGFLTGTMVFIFHQFKFRSKPKKDRHKKRTTTYPPEYLDENFSGNTYIHNNIFLPNPQNLEDRLSTTELDTTFSVDSEETAQVTDRPSTSAAGHSRRDHHHHEG